MRIVGIVVGWILTSQAGMVVMGFILAGIGLAAGGLCLLVFGKDFPPGPEDIPEPYDPAHAPSDEQDFASQIYRSGL